MPERIVRCLNQATSEALDTPSCASECKTSERACRRQSTGAPNTWQNCCGATSKDGLTESRPPESPDSETRPTCGQISRFRFTFQSDCTVAARSHQCKSISDIGRPHGERP